MQRGRDDEPRKRFRGEPEAAATGGIPASLLPLDVAETAAVDAGRLAALVNEAFQEQARRHGVDLS